ncbi:MAG: hypothetical protein MRZ79_21935 [Bacteroidia bacterium]|nr:hypothetical protein [Bacteroidia bacterium]
MQTFAIPLTSPQPNGIKAADSPNNFPIRKTAEWQPALKLPELLKQALKGKTRPTKNSFGTPLASAKVSANEFHFL